MNPESGASRFQQIGERLPNDLVSLGHDPVDELRHGANVIDQPAPDPPTTGRLRHHRPADRSSPLPGDEGMHVLESPAKAENFDV